MSSLQENLLEKTGELQAILDGITEPLVLIDPGFVYAESIDPHWNFPVNPRFYPS